MLDGSITSEDQIHGMFFFLEALSRGAHILSQDPHYATLVSEWIMDIEKMATWLIQNDTK